MNEVTLGLPIISISVFAIIGLLVEVFTKNKSAVYYFTIFAFILTAIASAFTLTIPKEAISSINPQELFSRGMVTFGSYASFFDLLFCVAAILALLASKPYLEKADYDHKEYYTLYLYAVAGMVYIAHSNNLLMLFIGIETMSLSFYILSGFIRNRIKSVEAALKYFLLGAFASGFLLYGMALIYGASGSLDLTIISGKMLAGGVNLTYMTIGIGLIIIGLGFKVAAFPFHMWAPDVYEGAPSVVTAFMSTAGKAAALIGLLVIAKNLIPTITVFPEMTNSADTQRLIIAIISAATMLVGNISAVVQTNIKRMLAYSSVAHAGYLLMGLVANNNDGWSGIAFYSTAYLFMQIGAFIIVSIIESKDEDRLNLKDYSGLSKSNPVLAAMMALFMLSLAGIPPMAGFFGKYYLFMAAIESGFTWLTIIAVISSIISVYFYIGLIVNMYFRESEAESSKFKSGFAMLSLAISVAAILFFGIFPGLLIDFANKLF